MQPAFTFEVRGHTGVATALRGLGLEVEEPTNALDQIAREGAEVAAAAAPHKSGRLAANIRGSRRRNAGVVEASEPYAGPINYGWPRRNIHAAGFMQEADRQLQTRAAQLLEEEIDHNIKRKGLT